MDEQRWWIIMNHEWTGEAWQTEDGCEQCQCDSEGRVQCASKECKTYECLPGQIEQITNTTCCGPSIICVCNPDDCPPAPQCAPFFRLETQPGDATHCCPKYQCLPPQGVCIYHPKNPSSSGTKGSADQSTESYTVGQTWSDGACVQCLCEDDQFAETKATAVCQKQQCPEPFDVDYVIVALPIDNQSEQCCPLLVRTACKYENNTYQVPSFDTTPHSTSILLVQAKRICHSGLD